jgi:hypothetical protein
MAARSSPGALAAPMLEDLSPEVLQAIARELLDIRDIRQLRLAARWLRECGAHAVRTLVAHDGGLPAEAWDAFPAAAGLHLGFSRGGGASHASAVVERLSSLAGMLPGRLGRLESSTAGIQEALRSRFAPRLVSCTAGLHHLDLGGLYITAQTADQLLRGLPSLGHLVLSAREDGAAAAAAPGEQRQQLVGAAAGAAAAVAQQARPPAAAPVVLQHFPSGLTYLQLQLGGIIDLDVSALAACSRLRDLDLLLEGYKGSLINIGSLAALAALEHLGFDEPLVDNYAGDVIAAASQLPQLQELVMPSTMIVTAAGSEPRWGQLAAMPSLLDLELFSLELDLRGAAPLHVTSLALHCELLGSKDPATGRVPELQPGCLTVLLPELQCLELYQVVEEPAECRTYGCHARIAAALQGHPHLQHLRINSWDAQHTDDEDGGEEPAEPCCQQHMRRQLASLQQLRTVRLLQCACQPVDEVLAVLAGCPQLQDLEVAYGMGGPPLRPPQPPQLAGRGLEQLALGACASSLRRVAVDLNRYAPSDAYHYCLTESDAAARGCGGFPLSQVARLLDGSCPQLQQLELQVVLEQQPLLGPVNADGVAFLAGGPVGEGLLRSMEGVAQQLQGQLQQLVGEGLGAVQLQWEGFQSMQHRHRPAADDICTLAPVPVIIVGMVGGTRVRWTAVWLDLK